MYNRVTTRKITRTEGPTYPTRAAQTVDAVVAKWIPATAALLACFVTPARADFDARYYESPNYPVRAAQTVDATVRTWIPAFDHELAQTRTGDRPSLDVRRYEWSPEFVSIPRLIDPTIAKWEPAFDHEHAQFVTGQRPPLDVRRYDWDPPESGWIKSIITTAPSVAQTWPAFQESGLSARTADGPRLDVRAYEWAPSFVSIPRLTDPTVATWVPALTDESARTPARPSLDVRQYDWVQPFTTPPPAASPDNGGSGPTNASGTCGWFVRRVYERTTGPQPVYFATLPVATPPTVDQTSPAWAFTGDRTGDRSRLDVRAYDWAPDKSSWIKATLPAAATVAQTSPAWANRDQYRTRSAPTLDLFRAHSIPDIFGVPDDWITWVPIQDDGSGRTADRARLDVRAYEWSQPAWIFKALPTGPAATVPQQVSVWTDDGGRTPAPPSLDVRRYDWAPSSAWIFAQLPLVPDATVAQQAAIWPTALTFSTRPRGGDVRTVDTQPAFTWVQPVVDAAIAKLAPIFRAELASFRSPDDPRLDVRSYAWAPDAAAWELINFAPPATQAQIWPALLQNLGTQYQTPARPTLDVRRYDWQPEFTWAARVVDLSVAKWAPIFQALIQSSPRTADRERLNVRTLTDTSGPTWLFANLPPSNISMVALAGDYRMVVSLSGDYRPSVSLIGDYQLSVLLIGDIASNG